MTGEEIGNDFAYHACLSKSVEEDALDTMLETSVVELDEALKLDGIGTYNPQTSLVDEEPGHHHHDNLIGVPGMIHHHHPQLQAPLPPSKRIGSPPKIAILARDEVFQSTLTQSPPPRKVRRADAQLVLGATTTAATTEPPPEPRHGRWTLDEKVLFLYGLQKYGKGKWKQIQNYCPGRSLIQIKSHGQKVIKRLKEGDNVFRKLEEHCARLHYLVTEIHAGNKNIRPPPRPTVNHKTSSEHILVASVLCQLGGDEGQQQQQGSAKAPSIHSISSSQGDS